MICDLAETYGVFNYRGLSVSMLVTLVFGLRDNSRVKMAMSDNEIPIDTYLLGYIADSLAFIAWTKTEGAQKNRNRPQSIIEAWKNKKTETACASFNTPEEFERARAKILKGE